MTEKELIEQLEDITEKLKNDGITEEEVNTLEEEARECQEKLRNFNLTKKRNKIADELNKGIVEARKVEEVMNDDNQKEVIEQRKKDLVEKRAVTVSSSKILAPTHQGNTINEKIGEVSTLCDEVDSIYLNGGESFQQSYVKAYKTGDLTEEGADYADGEPQFDYADMNKVKITAYAEISEEVEKLPAADYVSEVEKAVTIAVKKKMNSQMLVGDGKKSFNGIFKEPEAIDATKDLVISKIDETTLDEIVFSYGGDEDTNDEATLILSKEDLKAFATVRSADGKKVYEIDKKAKTIDKVPYVINSNCHALSKNDTQTGTYYCMAYGSLKNYLIPVFSDLEVKRSDDYKFKQGQIAFRAEVMTAGNVVAQDGFVRVKKVVA